MTTRESIPTEYKGITYDSKSEAVFARMLDLAGQEFVYHPSAGRHPWDFLVFPFHKITKRYLTQICGNTYESQKEGEFYAARPMLLELKPSEPNWTYVNRVLKDTPSNVNAFLVWGSPWVGPTLGSYTYNIYPLQANFSNSGMFMEFRRNTIRPARPISEFHDQELTLGISEKTIEKAMQYRFDLKQPDPFSDTYFDSFNG